MAILFTFKLQVSENMDSDPQVLNFQCVVTDPALVCQLGFTHFSQA